MAYLTLEVPDELAERIRPIASWLPAVLELSLAGFQTVAIATATEVIQFLTTNPSPSEILKYHVSERAQDRLRRLLALNEAGLLGEEEQRELDELQRLEHILVMFKARVAHHASQES